MHRAWPFLHMAVFGALVGKRSHVLKYCLGHARAAAVIAGNNSGSAECACHGRGMTQSFASLTIFNKTLGAV